MSSEQLLQHSAEGSNHQYKLNTIVPYAMHRSLSSKETSHKDSSSPDDADPLCNKTSSSLLLASLPPGMNTIDGQLCHESALSMQSSSMHCTLDGVIAGSFDQSVNCGDHICLFCRKSFMCKTHLDRHVRVHTGEKPFSCPHCSYKASQKGSVKRHIIMVHRNPPQSC